MPTQEGKCSYCLARKIVYPALLLVMGLLFIFIYWGASRSGGVIIFDNILHREKDWWENYDKEKILKSPTNPPEDTIFSLSSGEKAEIEFVCGSGRTPKIYHWTGSVKIDGIYKNSATITIDDKDTYYIFPETHRIYKSGSGVDLYIYDIQEDKVIMKVQRTAC